MTMCYLPYFTKLHGSCGLLVHPDLKTMVGLDKGRIASSQTHIAGYATTTSNTLARSTHK